MVGGKNRQECLCHGGRAGCHRADGNEQAGGIVADGGAFEFEFFEAAVAEVGEVIFKRGG